MYLYKLWNSEITRTPDEWLITHPPTRPNVSSPNAGDVAFIWTHEAGLIAECVIVGYPEDDPSLTSVVPIATYFQNILGPDWLSTADRDKTTIRSKLHCARHSNIWLLTAVEVNELDNYRRLLSPLDS